MRRSWSPPCRILLGRPITNMLCGPRYPRATRPLARATARRLSPKSRSDSTHRLLLKVRLRLNMANWGGTE